MRKLLLILTFLASVCCFGQKTTGENDDSLFLKRQLSFIQKSATNNQFDQLTASLTNTFVFNPFQEYKFPTGSILTLLPEYQHTFL